MKRFSLVLLIGLLACAPPPHAHAQFIGYTSPQSVQKRVFTAVNTTQTFLVPNLGQTAHYLSYTTTNNTGAVQIRIEASNDGVTFFPISEDGTSLLSGGVFANGYYPVIRVNLVNYTPNGGTLTASYSGSSAAPGNFLGIFNGAQQSHRVLFFNTSLNTNQSVIVPTPYGSSAGAISYSQSGVNSGTCVLTVAATTLAFNPTVTTVNIPTAAGTSTISIPALPADSVAVTFTGCGPSAATVSAEYFFSPLAASTTSFSYSTILANSSVQVKGTGGVLHGVTINTKGAAANTLTLFDNTACSGTVIGVIDTTGASTSLSYDLQFNVGLCATVATGTAANLTITYR